MIIPFMFYHCDPHHDELHPQTMSQHKPFLKLLLSGDTLLRCRTTKAATWILLRPKLNRLEDTDSLPGITSLFPLHPGSLATATASALGHFSTTGFTGNSQPPAAQELLLHRCASAHRAKSLLSPCRIPMAFSRHDPDCPPFGPCPLQTTPRQTHKFLSSQNVFPVLPPGLDTVWVYLRAPSSTHPEKPGTSLGSSPCAYYTVRDQGTMVMGRREGGLSMPSGVKHGGTGQRRNGRPAGKIKTCRCSTNLKWSY